MMHKTMGILFVFLIIGSVITSQAVSHSVRHTFHLEGKPDGGYYMEVELGTPAKPFNVLLDTGSSNFAVASYNNSNISSYFDPHNSSSYSSSGQMVAVRYTEGSWSGVLGSDIAALPDTNLSARVDMALITQSDAFFVNDSDWQGILGLGYQSIALSRGKSKPLPFLDSFTQAGLVEKTFSLLLCPPLDSDMSDDTPSGGKFTIGAADPLQYSGSLFSAAIVQAGFYQTLLTDIRVGGKSLNFSCIEYNTDKTIVDSGTTNLRLPIRVFESFVSQLKANSRLADELDMDFWSGVTPACSGKDNESESIIYDQFPMIALDLYHAEGQVLTLSVAPQQYLRPVASDEKPDSDCYKVAVASSTTGTVIGAVILEGYYVFFNPDNLSVSFAATTCQLRDDVSTQSKVDGYTGGPTYKACFYSHSSAHSLPAYAIALIVVASLLVLIVLIAALVKLYLRQTRRHVRLQNDIDIHNLVDSTFDTEY